MPRTLIGLKSDGITPVLKVMADEADDPLTTPNTDWTKFRINSEVDQIPYATLVKSYDITPTTRGVAPTFLPAGSDFSTCELYFIVPDTPATWKAGQIGIQVDPSLVFDNPNAFHYIRVSIPGYFDTLLWEVHGDYGSSGDWGQIVHMSPYQTFFVPAKNPSGVWSIVGGQETYFSAILGNRLVPCFGSDHIFTNSELNAMISAGTKIRVSFYELEMPADSSNYPATTGTPAPGKKILKLSSTTARMAKPGYDVETATDDQMLFSETKVPLAIIKTGLVSLPAGVETDVDLGQAIDQAAMIDYQIGVPGSPLFIPPYRGFKSVTQVRHQISGNTLKFMNDSDIALEARFYVMAKDSIPQTSGGGRVLEKLADGGIVIRKPGTGGTVQADVIWDSRWSYMPIVSQGWVPLASFVGDTFNGMSRKRYTVALTNDGSWKPYVLAKLARIGKGADINGVNWSNWTFYREPFTRQCGFVSHHGADSNFLIRVQDTQVDFYCGDGTDYEASYALSDTQGAYMNTVGLRYYIFAVPSSL